MVDIKWVKIEVGMYDDIKLKILDQTENRDLNQYVWARSVVLAGKINYGGYLYINDNIPYSIKTLSIEFNRSVNEIKSAFKILIELEMIEFTADKVYKIKNWDKHQNVEGMERVRQLNNERVARHRAKKKEINEKNDEEKTNNDNDNDVQEIDEINSESNNEKINNIDVKDDENTSNFIEEEYKENFTNSSSIENSNDTSINDECNVTCNSNDSNCNITVMEQIKKEKKNKKENKKESKNDLENNDEDKKKLTKIADKSILHENAENLNETLSDNFSDNENKDLLEKSNRNNLYQADGIIENKNININNQDVVKLLTYYESITGILGGLNIGFLKLAIDAHGYNNVKMAINKALEVNKANMTYINGILKNWRREGYPKDDVEVKKDGSRSAGKSNPADKNEFTGFKPKESRKLTEEQRKRAEENLI